MKGIVFILIITLAITNCAGVKVTKTDDPTKEGIRFYRPEPYLLVTKEVSKQNDQIVEKYISKIIWLPNNIDEYVIKTQTGIGVVKYNVTLTDGWQLTSFGNERDTQVPQTITAVTGALTGLLKIAAEGLDGSGTVTKKEDIVPGLYRFTFDKNGHINGLEVVFTETPISRK